MEATLVIAALKVVGYGLGTIGPGIGLGLCGYGLCVGSARQPELAGKLFTNALIFGALAEALPYRLRSYLHLLNRLYRFRNTC